MFSSFLDLARRASTRRGQIQTTRARGVSLPFGRRVALPACAKHISLACPRLKNGNGFQMMSFSCLFFSAYKRTTQMGSHLRSAPAASERIEEPGRKVRVSPGDVFRVAASLAFGLREVRHKRKGEQNDGDAGTFDRSANVTGPPPPGCADDP